MQIMSNKILKFADIKQKKTKLRSIIWFAKKIICLFSSGTFKKSKNVVKFDFLRKKNEPFTKWTILKWRHPNHIR